MKALERRATFMERALMAISIEQFGADGLWRNFHLFPLYRKWASQTSQFDHIKDRDLERVWTLALESSSF